MNDFSLLLRLVFTGLILTLITASCGGADESRLPWNMNALRKAPNYSVLSHTGNLAAIYYDSEPYKDKPTKVFAYIAYPQSVNGQAPAVVLVHGGAGRAFPEWAKMWADSGYVALAMDLDGRGPDGDPNEHAGPPLGSALDDCILPDAWPYHAVCDVIKGVSLLSSLPEVDPKRIGITGISWGGYVTCIVAGLDDRLKAAVPVYGCGYLADNSAWTDVFKQMSEDRRKKWIENFDPASHLSRAKMPVMFVSGTNDTHYYLDILQKSYRLVKKRSLCIIPDRPHGYDPGWYPVEIEIFMNSYLKGGSPLPSIKTPAVKDKTIEAEFDSKSPVASAKLHYTTDGGLWQKRKWQTADAQVKGNKVIAELPETRSLAYFLTITDNRGAIVSTEHEVITKAPLPGDVTMKSNKTVEAILNGLTLTFDAETGSIIKLQYPGPGTMLESSTDRASIIDLAYPIPKFEPLRLSPKHSKGARITKTDDAVMIYWDKLGMNRDCFPIEGNVSVTVRFKAAPDGKSIIMSAEVNNRSQNTVRQVVFPDFTGLLPFAGMDKTFFRSGAFGTLPFLELQPNEDRRSIQYMIDTACYSVEHKAGGMFSSMWIRWMDFGGLNGGLSLFPKRWAWDLQVTTRLHLSEVENKMRLLCLHDATVKPGEKWQSGEFWLTPHKHGWAEGIEPYRAWVQQNLKREYPVPKHVREGIGYRTTWMCQNQPDDPQDAIFKFKDLPKLAKECKEHGIDEMVLWSWAKGFTLPLPPPFPHLGTEQDMVDSVKECKKLGVNVVPFISILQANPESAPRYDLKVTDNNGWTYHTELVPRWNPPYATSYSCVQVGPLNKKWHQDVLDGCKHLVDIGVHSLSWDQYWTTNDPPPNMNSLTSLIRAYAKKTDPESTFSGEELWNIEIDAAYLDYTWNWGGYRDCRAFTSVFPAPRISSCISSSPMAVKKAFADSLYMNIFPRKAESINGSDYISSYPDFCKTLKQCAHLRKQFLPYFTEGRLIGECLLTDLVPAGHTTAYVLSDRALMVLINQTGDRNVAFDCDLEPWLNSASKSYKMIVYNADGTVVSSKDNIPSKYHADLGTMKTEEMMLVEFVAK